MQIGCHLPTQGPVATREAWFTFCHKAEEQQIAFLWVSDHVVFPKVNTSTYPWGRFPHAPETPYLEPVAVLAAVANVHLTRSYWCFGLHPGAPASHCHGQDADHY